VLRILLSLMTLVAVAAESAGQQPAATAPPAPPAAAPATPPPVAICPAHATAETCETPPWLAEPYQLVPARLNAEGKLVFRRQLNPASPVPCVALKKAADGNTTEEPRMADLFKPSIVVVHETLNPADASWFDCAGKPVDVEAVRKQLATWSPVLVLHDIKDACFGAPAETLLECFRPNLLIAVIPAATHLGAGRIESPSDKPAPAAPVPTHARMDEKGRVIFSWRRSCKPIWENRTREIIETTPTGLQKKTMNYKVCKMVTDSPDDLAVEPKYVQFFDAEGKPVEAAAAAPRLAKKTTVLVSADGEKVNAFYLKAAQPDALVCVLPFDILTARTVAAPPKAAPAPPCKAPAKAPEEEAAPLPSAAPKVAPPPSPDTAADSTSSGPSPATERTARLAEWENLKYGMYLLAQTAADTLP
jgi:hypothetical protein